MQPTTTSGIPNHSLALARPNPPLTTVALIVLVRRKINKDLLPPHVLCAAGAPRKRRLLRQRRAGPG